MKPRQHKNKASKLLPAALNSPLTPSLNDYSFYPGDRDQRAMPRRLAPEYEALVDPPSCTINPPCGHCHYCRLRQDGPDYWTKGTP